MIRTNQALLRYMAQHEPEGAGGVPISGGSFRPGERMIGQDRRLREAFVIATGIAKCFISGENSKDYIVEFLGPGEVIGEVEAIRGTSSITNVEAITAVTAYRIGSADFARLLRTDATFNGIILETLATRMSHTAARAATQQLFPVEYALLKLLSLLQEQRLDFSKQDLADYLAVSLRSFNRIVKGLREKGIVHPSALAISGGAADVTQLLRGFEEGRGA